MYRLSWLVAVALLSFPTTTFAAPKNVLLLISDNHTATGMGCYGYPDVRTPNLDALAARGTRFSHAFATVASCGPSRGRRCTRGTL
jgi:arylsulfatase A-like enzyme